MKNLLGATALMLLSAAAHHAAQAEEFTDDICAQRVADLCGNTPVGKCFEDQSMWTYIVSDCHGAVQTLIENEREAQQQNDTQPQEQDYGSNMPSAVNQFGFSYGGQLRMGPGMEFAKQASIEKGDQVEVIEDTGVWMDGYKWFKVRTPRGTGYHWGGIFCITGDQLPEGVFDNCQMLDGEN